MSDDTREPVDCAIVGGGPAGLVASYYLARFCRRVRLFDAGRSRARWIPTTHNCPGFAEGISGRDLLARLRRQACDSRVRVRDERIASIRHGDDGGFLLHGERGAWRARTVVVATGVVDRLPPWPGIEDAIATRRVRLCPVCDAFEAGDRRIAVLGRAQDGVAHAAFLRTWSRDVTLLLPPGTVLGEADRALADRLGIQRREVETDACRLQDEGLEVPGLAPFEVVYVALGTDARTAPVEALAPAMDDNEELKIDAHCRTSVAGLYAIGDAVSALNQLAVAFGHAAIAATAIHRELARNPR